MLDKKIVFNCVKDELKRKTDEIQVQFDDLQNSLLNETKSSAGDKHETGRGMVQLEQEKLSKSLTQITLLRNALSKVDPTESHKLIQYGSLVQTSNGYFFFSVGLGKISVEGEDVFCMTATSPLGQKLLGKQKGDQVQMNTTIEILDLI